jgi:hypothetical protein
MRQQLWQRMFRNEAMKENTKIKHRLMNGLLLTGALMLCGASAASAQVANKTYTGTGRDPFVKYKPPVRRKVVKKVAGPIAPPPIQLRIEQYRASKLAAMNRQQAAPKPTTALLLSEVQVTGIFRTPRGYAAMVEATPIKLSYVVYPGEAFYDGMLVAIEESRLVFRRETRWTDGRRDVAVDTKPLRQANAVTDSLAVTNAPAPASAPASGGGTPSAKLVVSAKDEEAPATAGGSIGANLQAIKDKFGSMGHQCPNGGTLNPDGTVLCK